MSQGGNATDPQRFLQFDGEVQPERMPNDDLWRYLLRRAVDYTDVTSPRLKTDAVFTGTLNVDLDAAGDSVEIKGRDSGNTLRTLLTKNDGTIIIEGAVTNIIPGTGATDLGKAEDSPHTSGDVGVLSLAVRQDADISLVNTDGDYAPLQVNDKGLLKVEVAESIGGAGGGTEFSEDSPHISGDNGKFCLTVRNDVLTSLVSTDGDYAPFQVNESGALYTTLNGETVTISDGGGSITVDGTVNISGTVTMEDGGGSITVDGTVSINAEKTEDSVHASGDTGNFVLAVRRDADTSLVDSDGDYAPLQVNDVGALKVDVISTVGGGADPVGLKNIAAATINPATEDTLATRASETTLLTIAKEVTLLLIKAALEAGVAEHHNGTAVVTPATVTFSGTSKSLLIDNKDTSGDLLVSFDGGTSTKTIDPGQSLSIEANHTSVQVSASSGTVPYEMLVTV